MQKKVLVPLFLVLAIASLFIGVAPISFDELFTGSENAWHILLDSRIPRMLSIVIAGIGMSIAGLIMQQISRNRFVSPTTATTEDGAKLGVLIAMIWFPHATTVTKMTFAFVCALIGTFLFLWIVKKIRTPHIILVPLIGIMLGNVIDSITSFFAFKFDLVQNIGAWLVGDFSLITTGNYEMLFLSIPFVALSIVYANQFTIVGLGEEMATNLGVSYQTFLRIGIAIVSLVSATVIITVGVIPFVGLIVPNIVSLYRGDNVQKSIWETALFGAIFLLACDIIGRVIIFPYEISISVTVGVVGGAIFLWLLLRKKGDVYAS